MKTVILSFFRLLIFSPFIMHGQNWSKDFDKDVNFIKMTEAGIAVVGTDDALYGLDEKGEVKWRNEKLKKVEEERIEVLSGSELIYVSDKGLLARNRVLNVLDGREYANTGTKGENIYAATVIHPANILLVFMGAKNLSGWDIATNEKVFTLEGDIPNQIAFEKMASLTFTFRGTQPFTYTSEKSAIIHLAAGYLAEYDFTTGQPKWNFDFKPHGKAEKASNPNGGYAAMKLDQKTNTLYFPFNDVLLAIDSKSGQSKWDKKAHKKPGQVRDIHIVPEGILVLKLDGLQLIDPGTGNKKWDKPLKVKGAESGLLVQDGNKFFTASKKYLLEIDVANKSSKQLTDKIKFEGNEYFSSIEMKGDNILLSSSQNIVGINKNTGEIAFQKYYKAPGASLTTIAQNVVLAAVAAAATLNSQRLGKQSADANGNYSYYQYTPAVMDAGTRKSANSDNYKYINTKFKGKGFGLAKVDKSSGELDSEIIIGDRSPIYATNENTGLIYYKSDKKTVACMPMK